MKSLLWRIPLGLLGLAGVAFGIFGISYKFIHPVPWEGGGVTLVGYSVALIWLSGFLIWVATWDEF